MIILRRLAGFDISVGGPFCPLHVRGNYFLGPCLRLAGIRDTADLLGEIYSVRGDKAKGREWLKKAVGCRKEILDPKLKETEGKLEGMG